MPKERRGLGRGLESLISDQRVTGSHAMEQLTQDIPIDQISPNPHQPRRVFDPDSLAELAESIRVHGILQPLILARAAPTSPTPYYIIAGERRWRAAKMAGLTHVPAIIKDATQQQLLEWALVENVQREDLNPLEAAAAYKSLMDAFQLTQAQVAARVGKSRAAVANTLRLLNLPAEIQAALWDGRISEGHARALLGLPTPEQQKALLQRILAEGLTVRQTEALVRQWLHPERAQPAPKERTDSTLPPDWRVLQDMLAETLGTRVDLQRGKRGGRIVIHFYSDEELDALLGRLLGETAPDV